MEVRGFKIKPLGGMTVEERSKLPPEEQIAELARSGVEARFTAFGDPFPYPVELTLGRDKHGQLAVTRLVIDVGETGGAGISSTGLREVGAGIGDLLRRVAEHQLEDSFLWELLGPLLNDAARPYAGVASRPGRRGHSDAYYREVAEGYAAALAEDPARPYTLLARQLFKSEGQARRLVKRAWEKYPELRPDVGGES